MPYGLTMLSESGENPPYNTLSQTPPKIAFTMPEMSLSTQIRFRVRNTFYNIPLASTAKIEGSRKHIKSWCKIRRIQKW